MQIPTLHTDRMILRAPRLEDLEREIFLCSDAAHTRFVGGVKSAYECQQAILSRIGQWHAKGFGAFHLEHKETGEVLGRVGCLEPYGWPEPEIGWTLMPDCLGQGYGTEAALRVRQFAYETLGWTTAISLIDPKNTGSQRLAERLDASFERVFEHVEFGPLYIWRHPGPGEAATS